jgi:hypothetical protein
MSDGKGLIMYREISAITNQYLSFTTSQYLTFFTKIFPREILTRQKKERLCFSHEPLSSIAFSGD